MRDGAMEKKLTDDELHGTILQYAIRRIASCGIAVHRMPQRGDICQSTKAPASTCLVKAHTVQPESGETPVVSLEPICDPLQCAELRGSIIVPTGHITSK